MEWDPCFPETYTGWERVILHIGFGMVNFSRLACTAQLTNNVKRDSPLKQWRGYPWQLLLEINGEKREYIEVKPSQQKMSDYHKIVNEHLTLKLWALSALYQISSTSHFNKRTGSSYEVLNRSKTDRNSLS